MTKMRYGLAPVVNAMSFIWVKDLIVLSGICCPLLMMHSPHFCARRLTSGQKIDRPIKALYPALPSAPLPPLPPKWRGAELGVCHVSQEAWLRDVSVDVSGCALTANSLSRVRTLICGRGLIDWALHLMTQMHSGRPDFLSPLPLPSVSVFSPSLQTFSTLLVLFSLLFITHSALSFASWGICRTRPHSLFG